MSHPDVPSTNPSLLGRLGRSPHDQDAWKAFVTRYGPVIHHWCRRWATADDAEDLTQEVLIRLSRRMPSFVYDPGRSFRGYLRQVAKSAFLTAVTRRQPGASGSGDSDALRQLHQVEAREDFVRRIEDEYDMEIFEAACRRVREDVTPTR